MKRKVYKDVNEIVYVTTLKNKMKVILLYKKDFLEKSAYIATRFGHFDSERKIKVNNKMIKVPYGAAHFLEHRMFSINGEDASELFSSLGADSNAYTTYEKTAYFFNTTDKFYECLGILLKMMDSFSSTAEEIENEKSIIIQEMKTSYDNPSWLINSIIHKNSYFNHPIKEDVIGSLETIQNTDYDTLKAIFDTFYDPSNLTLVVCGDINHLELENYLNNHLLSIKNPKKIKPLNIEEPSDVVKDYEKATLETINNPHMALLYKLPIYKDLKKKDKIYYCYNLILDYLFSSSGVISEKWLKSNIIKRLVDYSVVSNVDLDNIIIYNINDNIWLVIDAIKELFSGKSKLNMTNDDLNKLKKCHYGVTLQAYDSVSSLSSYYVYDLFSSANDFFDEYKEVSSITLDDINEAFDNICNAKTSVVVLTNK